MTALILGGAECVLEDAKAALELFKPDAVLVINDMIPLWAGRVDFIVSLHPNKLVNWIERRRARGYPMGKVWAPKNKRCGVRIPKIDREFPDEWGGSSGLYAIHILLSEGFNRIVLAGVPMLREARHIIRSQNWNAANGHQVGWRKCREIIAPHVRSMSGWTAELLGKPDKDWFNV